MFVVRRETDLIFNCTPNSQKLVFTKLLYIFEQKVDIYSLGVIFFEMCYKPMQTDMERVKILGELRSRKITLPEDFDQMEMENQVIYRLVVVIM